MGKNNSKLVMDKSGKATKKTVLLKCIRRLNVFPLTEDPVPSFNWVFEKLPIALGIVTQPSRYKRAESNLLTDYKGLQHGDSGSCLVIHLYYKFILLITKYRRRLIYV